MHVGATRRRSSRRSTRWSTRRGSTTLEHQARQRLLILDTGSRSPQSLRKPIERIVGKHASIQSSSSPAPDLDISAQQTAFLVGTIADAVGVFNYTVIGGGRIAPEPAWVRSHIATEQVPILGAVTCNS